MSPLANGEAIYKAGKDLQQLSRLLCIGCSEGNTDMIDTLLSGRRINPNLKYNNLIEGQERELFPLFAASLAGNEYAVKRLLRTKGINVNMINADGQTALHAAVINGKHPLIVEALITAGANIALKDNWELRPIDCVDHYDRTCDAKIKKILSSATLVVNLKRMAFLLILGAFLMHLSKSFIVWQ